MAERDTSAHEQELTEDRRDEAEEDLEDEVEPEDDDEESPVTSVVEPNTAMAKCVGMMYVWVRGDSLPDVEAPARFNVRRVDRPRVLGDISGLSVHQIEQRIRDGHVPYVASVRGTLVGCGWSAWRLAGIGELGRSLRLPLRDHYLWDFFTVPEWRNQGVYSRMLQEIIKFERDQAVRFWVGHDMENEHSGRGIVSAGFTPVGEVWDHDGDLMFAALDHHRFANEAAAMLSIPLATTN